MTIIQVLRRGIFLLGFVLSISGPLFAQSRQTLRGVVVDKESKYPLPGAAVVVTGQHGLGEICREDGSFTIRQVPAGRYTVNVKFIGYRDAVLHNVVVDAGRETVLLVELEEQASVLDEVVIRHVTRSGEPGNEMAFISSRRFSVEETSRYAGSRGEPARMASNFAGVQGADDSRNDIIIRGNSPSGVLWRLEGISIPNPNHFAIPGTSGGPVGIINSKYLANSDFFTGAFPAEFGNSIAGVFDLKLRNGNSKKHEFVGQFGFLGTEAMAEGPLSKKKGSSYLASFRYANLWLFNRLGIDIGTQAVPSYTDGFFRLNFPVKNGGSLALWGVGGTSDINLLISGQEVKDRNIFGQNDRDQYYTARMGAAGLTYSQPLSRSAFFRATLGLTGNLQDASHDYLFIRKDAQGLPLVENDRYVLDGKAQILRYVFNESKVAASASLNRKLGGKSILKAGINLDLIRFRSDDSTRFFIDHAQSVLGGWQTRWDSDRSHVLFQPYAQWKYLLTHRLTTHLGVSGLFSSMNKASRSFPEPRAGISYDLTGRQKIALSSGLHSQMMPSYLYFYQPDQEKKEPLNSDIGLTKSWHHGAAYSWMAGRNLKFLAEIYHQSLFNVPVSSSPSSSFSILNTGSGFSRQFPDKLENTGIGRNYGAEVTLERFFSAGYYFLITGSVFDSKYRAGDGKWRNTDFNGHYAFNALFSREFRTGTRSVFNVGAKFTTIGGRRYGPVDEEKSRLLQEIVYQDAGRNTLQFAPYRRLDVKMEYKLNRSGLTHTVAVDLVNVPGVKNQLSLSYAPQPDGSFIKQEYQLGFLPVFFYRIDF